jgi:hypothetical protein
VKVVISDGLKGKLGSLTESTVDDEVKRLNEQYGNIAHVTRAGGTIYVMENLMESDGSTGIK